MWVPTEAAMNAGGALREKGEMTELSKPPEPAKTWWERLRGS